MAADSTSIVSRVAVATAGAAASAALIAAVAASFIADRLVVDAEDRRLRATSAIVLAEMALVGDRATRVKEIEDEARELAPASIRLAARDEAGFIAGDASLPNLAPGTCSSVRQSDVDQRACAAGRGSVVVVASAARGSAPPALLALGCLLAAAAAAAFAAMVSRRAARWALEPLTKLTGEVRAMRVDGPKVVSLEPSDPCAEVAVLRGALSSLLTRLAESLERAQRFSAEAAHELRTPLTAITAELDLLSEEALDEASRSSVMRLRTRAGSLARLIDGLLALASSRERPRPEATEAVVLEDVAREVVARLGEDARRRVDVSVETAGTVRGDEALLVSLVENAVDNALKFSGRGRVRVRVSEGSDTARPTVVLDVTDEGPGIPAEQRRLVFEPFFRAPSSRAGGTPGHGIGLALVAHIASAHGGSASLVDATKGAHLRVWLPAWAPIT